MIHKIMATPQTNGPLRLDRTDLFSPRVESYLEERAALKRQMPQIDVQPLVVKIIYSNWFYLSVACLVGALIGWGILEPFFDDRRAAQMREDHIDPIALLLFPTVAGFIGMFLGAAEGLMCRNPTRALKSAAVGLGVGFGGGLVALFPCGIVFAIAKQIALEHTRPGQMPHGFGLLVLMLGRAGAWAIIAIAAGAGQGIAVRERKVVINGILGGMLGGLIGGLLFDPIAFWLTSPTGKATMSRGVGFAIIGIMVGLFVGLVEQWTKSAWLLMRAGPLAGKQFVLYKNPTVLGSSPKADVYLFKDAAIEPRHALIHNRGGRFEIEDCNTPDGTYINGVPIRSQILKSGDQVVLGKTALEFLLKESK
ncbi:MAG TPA: FHA domain-containing protein [Pirellulales bacterium]|nr:FHA domain-containing protein [Pirellulales bacterium]